MAHVATHRQVVYRVLPQTRGNWGWLDMTLEAQRQVCNAVLEERIDCYRKTGRSVTPFDQFKSLTICRRDIPMPTSMRQRTSVTSRWSAFFQ